MILLNLANCIPVLYLFFLSFSLSISANLISKTFPIFFFIIVITALPLVQGGIGPYIVFLFLSFFVIYLVIYSTPFPGPAPMLSPPPLPAKNSHFPLFVFFPPPALLFPSPPPSIPFPFLFIAFPFRPFLSYHFCPSLYSLFS